MLAWGLGLPLLFWHRWPRISRAQAWFVIGFVGTSLLSQPTLGECVLTTLARELWEYRESKALWVGSASLRQRNPGLCETVRDLEVAPEPS